MFKARKLSRWVTAVALAAAVWTVGSRNLFSSSPAAPANPKAPTPGPRTEPHPEVMSLQQSFSQVADTVKPAVVSISTTHIEKVGSGHQFYFGDPMEQFFDQFFGNEGAAPHGNRARPRGRQRQFKMEGVGSGVLIDADGLVLTNEHVVRDADEIKVVVYDKEGNKKDYTGRVVGKDARTDLAVVRIKAGKKLQHAALGDSDQVKTGDWAIAIGSPFGLAQTFTVGVISSAHQTLTIEDRQYRNMIQTDAAINRGNSGGPLLNIRGEVVGINTAIYAPTGVFAGIGFAVPINDAKAILRDLVEKGRVTRGWLGVELAGEISPAMVNAFGLKDTNGALVNDVLKNSPAEKAGLKRGDVIVSYNRNPVESSDKLQNMVAQTAPKKTVPLEVIRNRKRVTLSLTIGVRPESADTGERGAAPGESKPKDDDKSAEKEWLGVHVVRVTPDLAENFRQPRDAEGVLVTDIDGGSQGEEMGLMPGDIIRSVNQTPTPDPKTFASVTSKVKLTDGIVLDILRQGRAMYLSYTKE